ncbi:TetR/AcrR family transcriptional regulator [Caulobacter flavus]|jgi:AcrR family transcriptional regulator|uniref:TetR/AcrR family transcriptional regulator n=4 Tax=Caulobacter TaxID=75 RepID=A0A2T9JLY9_9CAUL|nr:MULTISPECIES: TetR/AcrR family transcriptional regulator [Caulobacter]AYV46368.1 TetR/AcrR family transcriptional regulator [Caulobacter flavus]NGM51682.1 TetR/AcrR family transcriptional regulator [Caulobacter sp. 602-2]PLR12037.1 TetR/AcrR family transcriptional regulator [Caulobacter flavus]PLR24325.1 TetR/AcrR family transcriptional regulator [Caulobacter zeae]PVM84701.1 TetR/AcrR family transcriptional regulator [Caulobacter radicis]
MSNIAYFPAMPPREDNRPGKRERTKTANRQAILDAARQVFGELGYDGATVRDIIRLTGLASGTFYNYYKSKEEVFDALADDGARRFRPLLRVEFEKATDFASFLRGAMRAYFDFLAAEHETWRVNRPAGETHPQVRATPEVTAVFAEVREAFERVLERDHAPPVDLDYLTAACIAVAREVGDKMLERRPMDTQGATAFAVGLILGGLPALPRP